jgi:hypothetical protein
MTWNVKVHRDAAKQLEAIPVFKPIHAIHSVEVLLILLRNEGTDK